MIVIVRAEVAHAAAAGANVSELGVAVLVLGARVVTALHPAVHGQPRAGHPGQQQRTPKSPHVRTKILSAKKHDSHARTERRTALSFAF